MRIDSVIVGILTLVLVWLGNRVELTPSQSIQQRHLVVCFSEVARPSLRSDLVEDAVVMVLYPQFGFDDGDVVYFRNEDGVFRYWCTIDRDNRVIYRR